MALVPIISQSWDTNSVFTPTRMNNIEQNLAIVSDATGVKYSNGVSVKDKIDNMMNWTYVGAITSSTSQTYPDGCKEIMLIAMNSSLGTAFGSMILPGDAVPQVMIVPYDSTSNLSLSRSTRTISFMDTSATTKACKLFYR